MATIENDASLDAAFFDGMTDEELVAQDLVQQGAIHAVSFLLEHGCTEGTATDMLLSLRELADRIRAEAAKRGKTLLFETDQTVTGRAARREGGA
ncbi:hypothetical protein [Cupriavidus sp. USMAA2-4]|uniref:hypothetical protein n=1 Tax=Cupriavidus sp. USMAA2-4 TaxID=876364 RepID=UPI001E3EAF10|nr:hypothetical protein [Cupriavidus sp. USMAA2-4]